ncbi:UPF0182 family protein [Nocardioides sp. BP30]|uniref:UPF0182 family membrane protein n=1 Tax=Nocardioides sp. BP30 TaxID=3036374 RepID=UPI0024683826|nr:UPF0182 family protein [Nocardioides sp. BP30]WGL51432.1 UPF0182 family protein [Nocardioides sp. BP30]
MSELYDDDPVGAPRSSSRLRVFTASALVLVLLIVLVNRFAAFYTDHLWYDSVHAGHVFTTLFWTKVGLFAVFGLLMALAIGGSMVLAFRARPFFSPAEEHSSLTRYRDAVTPIRTWLLVGVSVLSGIFAGVSGAGRWRLYLLWRHGGSFGQKDPHFHKDVGFYVFDLPWWHYLVDFALTATALGLVAAVVVHYLYGGIRLQGGGQRMTAAAQAHVSVLLGAFVLLKGLDYWLDRYDLVHSNGPLFTGIGFTDDHAVLPAKNILSGIALICAVLLFVNIWRRTWELPAIGLALLVLSSVLLGLIWPAIVQGFQVNPSRSDKERSYVAANIAATRTAYAIDDANVAQQNYPDTADASKASASALDEQASSLPVADPVALQPQFEQTQQVKSYYQVTNPLDVDRYTVDGQDRAVVLGVREVKDAGITGSDRNWTNLHTVYTHSDGVIAAYANQRDKSDTTEGRDVQWAQNSDVDDLSGGPIEDRIYYGEHSPNYSVVGRPKGASSVELDLGSNGSDNATTTTYDGKGGVAIDSTFRQLLYAVKFGSASFLLSERVNDQSKVLYNRDPKTAVHKVAPWLTLDSNPYPVVTGGRIEWVVDGYTTTDEYPESERESLRTMTDDATQATPGLRALPNDDINYMRNSVKATVDAYDGTVTLYEWDPDPILKAWESAFPGVVKPKKDIPADLLPHLRYPDYLYKVQRYQLARYHVTNATDFLRGSDRWQVPESPSVAGHLQTPARMFLDSSDGKKTWAMTSTFVPDSRSNLAAIMTVDSDATASDYGKITLLTGFDQNASGPAQVYNAFRNNTKIAEVIGAFARSGSSAVYGNLLTVPLTGTGLLYVQPVYAVQATGSPSSYPVLAYVLVSYDGQLGYGPTLGDALTDALKNGGEGSTTTSPGGGTPGSSTPSPSDSASPSPTGSTTPSAPTTPPAKSGAAALLAQAKDLFAQADAAGKAGKFTQREKLIKQAEKLVSQAAEKLSGS